ncbi:alternate-type signal peptide domain-containing protein [Microbacterium sp. JZ31]|uniref:alternate-type signal peptide domain-containing protein n=1 Tax=Microbacterium sp. JZ31 TaxID=1906274 RepID=UPI001931B9D2|nr:alternate-type signal peptide domain-containing protein [Microbacterium sp. JZ31]
MVRIFVSLPTSLENLVNKFAKGSIAAAAGIVLLLGGVGSLAYWNDSADLDGVAVNAGQLALTAADGTWGTDRIERWVPGDEATYEATLKLETSGENIAGLITLDTAALKAAVAEQAQDTVTSALPAGVDAADILDQFSFDFTADIARATVPTGAALTAATDGYAFDGAGTYSIPVTVTVTFEDAGAGDNDAQNAAIDLGDLPFVATQTVD